MRKKREGIKETVEILSVCELRFSISFEIFFCVFFLFHFSRAFGTHHKNLFLFLSFTRFFIYNESLLTIKRWFLTANKVLGNFDQNVRRSISFDGIKCSFLKCAEKFWHA